MGIQRRAGRASKSTPQPFLFLCFLSFWQLFRILRSWQAAAAAPTPAASVQPAMPAPPDLYPWPDVSGWNLVVVCDACQGHNTTGRGRLVGRRVQQYRWLCRKQLRRSRSRMRIHPAVQQIPQTHHYSPPRLAQRPAPLQAAGTQTGPARRCCRHSRGGGAGSGTTGLLGSSSRQRQAGACRSLTPKPTPIKPLETVGATSCLRSAGWGHSRSRRPPPTTENCGLEYHHSKPGPPYLQYPHIELKWPGRSSLGPSAVFQRNAARSQSPST